MLEVPTAPGVVARLRDLSIVIVAAAGFALLWSQYSSLSALSWWYENTRSLPARTAARTPDYDLTTLTWKVASPRRFEVNRGTMTLATSPEPFAYQAFATISTGGAAAVDIEFELAVEAGGVTIGLLQGGKWIAINSTAKAGGFVGSNAAQLGYRRSLTVMIANNNPAGESRLSVTSLRLFLRK